MKHPIRSLCLSLAFIGLVLLALNPQFVVKIQSTLGFSPDYTERETPADIQKEVPTPPSLPEKTNPPTEVEPETNNPPRLEDVTSPRPSQPVMPKTAIPDIHNLPRIEPIDQISKNDRWIGETPCGLDIFEVPLSLAGVGPREEGPIFTKTLEAHLGQKITNQSTYIFKSKNGVRLRIVKPVIKYYPVKGRRFENAEKDIFDRKPLDITSPEYSGRDELEDGKKSAIFANISSPSSLSIATYGFGNDFSLITNKVELTSAYLITLPQWTTYQTAPAQDKAKWDDLLCNAAHHELGHLRIRLDIYAETLDGYAALPGGLPNDEIRRLTTAYRKKVDDLIDERQNAFHIYNDGGMRRGMTELPYAELPFPWLKTAQSKTAEQSPE